ncbi:MAG: thermonuclease family protein [Mesorhizobium sp.]|nr:MAG: thermonuclease family protein [Mesorhizobium sp.]
MRKRFFSHKSLAAILVITLAVGAYVTSYFTGWGNQIAGPNTASALGSKPKPIVGVASIVDGDTIEIHGQRIRFNGIDAPESSQNCSDASGQEYPCGRKSAEALDIFLSQSRPIQCNFVSWDRYNRFVGDCQRADGASIASWMVEQGYDLDWPRYSHGSYASQQADAQRAKIGIWVGTFTAPWDWRATHAANNKPGNDTSYGLTGRRQIAQSYSCQPRRYCKQISSCDEARWYLNNCSWGPKLDRDGDGIPCEGIC